MITFLLCVYILYEKLSERVQERNKQQQVRYLLNSPEPGSLLSPPGWRRRWPHTPSRRWSLRTSSAPGHEHHRSLDDDSGLALKPHVIVDRHSPRWTCSWWRWWDCGWWGTSCFCMWSPQGPVGSYEPLWRSKEKKNSTKPKCLPQSRKINVNT